MMARPIPAPTAAAVVGPWLTQIIGAGSVDADPLQLGQELATWRRGGPVPDLPPGVTLPAELVGLVIAERPAGAAAAVPPPGLLACPEVARINRSTDALIRRWRRISRRRGRRLQGQAKPQQVWQH
jgi:hypothetical protein